MVGIRPHVWLRPSVDSFSPINALFAMEHIYDSMQRKCFCRMAGVASALFLQRMQSLSRCIY